ncbi:MAG: type VI secretion system baseplate subunit TssK [Alphaproteobacteria bacterium]|nr:type VI secretion system baseplate subunit TssK [Alphaproteobacteria bacterium]
MSIKELLPITPQIQWHEGMMLSPQHFQQSDLRNYQILTHQFKLTSNCHWGIKSVKFDPIVLPDGLVRILDLEAVMPDALIIHYSANMTEIPPLEIDLRPYKPSTPNEELTIYLAMPERLSDSSPIIGEFPRFHSTEGYDVDDENTIDNRIKIPRLLPKLSLHVGNTPPSRCWAFPLLKVSFVDESFAKSSYTPPCFFLEKKDPLWQACGDIAQKIREKASSLCEKWQNQIGTPMLQETSALLRPLVMALPGFEMIVHGTAVHPYVIYQELCDVVGYLAPLRLSQIPPVLPVYQHNDLNACFYPVINIIMQYLNSIELSFAIFPFSQKERLFYVRLHKNYMTDKLYVGIRAPKGMTESELADWMRDAVIASDFAVEKARTQRITGAARTMLEGETLYELMPSRGIIIFEIKNDPDFIQPDQNVNIFNPADNPDRRPSEIALYVRKGGE